MKMICQERAYPHILRLQQRLKRKGEKADAKYSQAWEILNSVEDGSRVSKGWFKVVSAEYLNADKYNDDEDSWYYADGSGNLLASSRPLKVRSMHSVMAA